MRGFGWVRVRVRVRVPGRGRVPGRVQGRVPVWARVAAVALATGLVAVSAGGCSGGPSVASGGPGPSDSTDSAVPGATSAVTPLEPLPTAATAALAPYYAQRPTWQPCDGGFECTTFRVPMDYDRPGDGDLTLSAARAAVEAAGSGDPRVGSLLLNPGGPGGSAIEYLEAVARTYDRAVRARYDLVGLDPRGVGRSNPVSCLSGDRMDAFTSADLAPGDQRAIDALVAADKEFAEGCRKQAGPVLGHLSTVEAARDMDVLRALLGDERLNFVGKSYGTFLGATYAGLFPSRVGRVVLDGAMDPALDSVTGNRTQAGGFETAWAAFAKDCAKREDCPFGRTEQQVGEQLTALLAAVHANPLRSSDHGRRLTGSQATTGVVQALYAEFLWPELRTALSDAKAGDGTGLLKLSDAYYGREADGSYPNMMFANAAVNCLDLPAPFRSPEDVQRAVPDFERASPHFGRDIAWMALTCAYWPVRATGAAHTIRAAGAAPIVVVGTTRDPATPYDWARSLAGQLESGRLLTYDGDGHTAYGRRSTCVDGAVNRFLLTGEAPEQDRRCDS
ncbi:alpha/beta hydrolase [Kitasatospora aureofaciens]|uniref:Proteinase n=1 Tax=Kitasatospora aureofaciens TaxID=1894 RepID=A0A8H9HV55_KITAU|nr:alpha/beta hydrolase [Kitasatospora aureofaciens]ARF79680.1 proteinase [Kitasatospora aureofaciens]GGU87729.1 proteinase [Kitasatospora aureofaciens]